MQPSPGVVVLASASPPRCGIVFGPSYRQHCCTSSPRSSAPSSSPAGGVCGSLPPSSCCFCLATVRHFTGLSAAVPPLRRRDGRSLSRPPSCAPFQPHRQAHDCPTTPMSPTGVLFQPHLFAGLWFNNFFAAFYTYATAGRRCTWNLELSLLPLHAAIF